MSGRTLLEPPALAMVWDRPGAPHRAAEVTEVDLAPGDALVALELATICGSDVHTVAGQRSTPTPTVLGHEQVGRVVAVGEAARGADGAPLAVGDRVVWSVTVSCDDCDRCRTGLPQKCRNLRKFGHAAVTPAWALNGAFATHAHLPAGTTIVPVGDDTPAEVLAPVSCGTATAWAAVRAALGDRDPAGLSLLVTGAGLIGLTATAIATSHGVRVTVSDLDPARRRLAMQFGAMQVLDAQEPLGDDRFDASLEASGAGPAVATAIAALDAGGTAALVGSVFPSPPVPLDAESIVRRLATVRGVHNYRPRDLQDAAAWIEAHHDRFPFAELVGGRVELADLDAGFQLARSGRHVRVAVSPR